MIQAVIFDIDGTLIDSVDLHAQAWQDAFDDYGFQFDLAAIRSQIAKGGDQLLPVFLVDAEREAKGKQIEAHRSALFKDRYLSRIKPFADVPSLMQAIRSAGVRTALASSAKQEELETFQNIAGINGLIDIAASSDDAERSKPHPDIFAAALEKLGGPDPAAVLAIGDSPFDAQAAGKLSIRTIGVLCGGFAEADLREAGCIAVYRDPAALLQDLHGWLTPG